MQAAPGERYLHEIAQHALGVLQIVSLVPYTRRLVVGSTLSNDRSGMAVFLDSASGVAFCDPEVSVSSPVPFFYDFLLPDPLFCMGILNLLFGLDSLSLFTWAPACTLMEFG